ncbi:hypothetical protein BX616_004152, partial [Lobosporangium transversale]
ITKNHPQLAAPQHHLRFSKWQQSGFSLEQGFRVTLPKTIQNVVGFSLFGLVNSKAF